MLLCYCTYLYSKQVQFIFRTVKTKKECSSPLQCTLVARVYMTRRLLSTHFRTFISRRVGTYILQWQYIRTFHQVRRQIHINSIVAWLWGREGLTGNEILRERRWRCEKAPDVAAHFRNPLTSAGKGAKTDRKGGASRILKAVVGNTPGSYVQNEMYCGQAMYIVVTNNYNILMCIIVR